jgi:hypothetical protein
MSWISAETDAFIDPPHADICAASLFQNGGRIEHKTKTKFAIDSFPVAGVVLSYCL